MRAPQAKPYTGIPAPWIAAASEAKSTTTLTKSVGATQLGGVGVGHRGAARGGTGVDDNGQHGVDVDPCVLHLRRQRVRQRRHCRHGRAVDTVTGIALHRRARRHVHDRAPAGGSQHRRSPRHTVKAVQIRSSRCSRAASSASATRVQG